MAVDYLVTGSEQKTRLVGRQVMHVQEVTAATQNGDVFWVDVPLDALSADHAAALLEATAQTLAAIRQIPGVTVGTITEEMDYSTGHEMPVFRVTFTTPTGSSGVVDLPADGLDAAKAAEVIGARVQAIDAIANL